MFLTPEQLEQLTGYRRPTDQRRWLVQNGYCFDVRADGKPSLLVSAVEARHSGGKAKAKTAHNWEHLR